MTAAKTGRRVGACPTRPPLLGELAEALRRVGRGDLKVRLPRAAGVAGEVADAFNEVVVAAGAAEPGAYADQPGRRPRRPADRAARRGGPRRRLGRRRPGGQLA